MSRTAPLRRILNTLVVLAMLVVGTLAADKAAAHIATRAAMAVAEAAQPPCHRMHHADGLAQTPVNPCDTICAGSAPESTYDALPLRFEPPVVSVAVAPATAAPAPAPAPAPAVHYGHGPPPLPAYLRDRRLLI